MLNIFKIIGLTALVMLLILRPAWADDEQLLLMDLPQGRVTIKMLPDLAPRHVARVKDLVRTGFYDGTPFHRVIAGFMAQGGDPTGTGNGGSGQMMQPEFSSTPFKRGVVAMSRSTDPNSADSQFFIMLADNAGLNGHYTVWGQVVDGMQNVDGLAKSRSKDGFVAQPDRIVRMSVAADQDMSPAAQARIAAAKARLQQQAAAREVQRVADEKEKAKAQAAAQARKDEENRRLAAAYGARKSVGDLICLDGSKALGLISITIKGFVERVEGSRIQIRIADADGGTNYNGVSLRRDSIIWDEYSNWRKC